MNAPSRQTAGQTDQKLPGDPLPWIFYPVFLSLCLPTFFSLGSLQMTVSRFLLLVLTPVLMVKLLSGRAGKIRLTDVLIMLFMVWFAMSIFVNNRSAFVTFVGSNMLILLGGYLVGRVWIRSPRAFRQMIFLYGGAILVSLPFALYESQTSHMVIARFLDKFPIISGAHDVNYGQRHGLYRVQVTFTHPIHYGLFCTICFSLVVIGLRQRIATPLRWLWGGAILLCCFVSVSSGPVLGIIIQIFLILYAYVTRAFSSRWKLLIIAAIASYLILDLLSDRPAYYAILERLAFNSSTAYVRKILLDYGLAQVGRTPLFGVGYNTWNLPSYMTGSLDNYWLMVALLYGIPAFIFFLGAYLYTLIKVGKVDLSGDSLQENLRLAWAISTVGTMFTLATVAIWSEMASLVFFALGSGVWFIDARATETREAPEPNPDRRPRFSRFSPAAASPAYSRMTPH